MTIRFSVIYPERGMLDCHVRKGICKIQRLFRKPPLYSGNSLVFLSFQQGANGHGARIFHVLLLSGEMGERQDDLVHRVLSCGKDGWKDGAWHGYGTS
jgi:hypothetical protein